MTFGTKLLVGLVALFGLWSQPAAQTVTPPGSQVGGSGPPVTGTPLVASHGYGLVWWNKPLWEVNVSIGEQCVECVCFISGTAGITDNLPTMDCAILNVSLMVTSCVDESCPGGFKLGQTAIVKYECCSRIGAKLAGVTVEFKECFSKTATLTAC